MHQSFWKRWASEYVTQLQARSKWRSKTDDSMLKIGQLVVIKSDNVPPLRWQLGGICELHPGVDGLIRVVSVKTNAGVLKRSLPRVCILPLDI